MHCANSWPHDVEPWKLTIAHDVARRGERLRVPARVEVVAERCRADRRGSRARAATSSSASNPGGRTTYICTVVAARALELDLAAPRRTRCRSSASAVNVVSGFGAPVRRARASTPRPAAPCVWCVKHSRAARRPRAPRESPPSDHAPRASPPPARARTASRARSSSASEHDASRAVELPALGRAVPVPRSARCARRSCGRSASSRTRSA